METVDREPLFDTLSQLLAEVRATTDYSTYMSLCRRRRKMEPASTESGRGAAVRIAILGGATTDFLKWPVELELETLGRSSTILCGDYNNYVSEMMERDSRTAAFRPDVAVLLVTPYNIADWPSVGDPAETVQAMVDRVADQWLRLCETLHANTNCEIVLGNLHLLPTRAAGNFGARLAWEPNSYLRQINLALSRRAPGYVHLFDIETLSALYGVSNWVDPRFWYHAKQPVSFACMVPYVRNLASIIGAVYGHTAKCLVLDLDNTLWGGVVGDDGIGGLKIGEGDAVGEAYKAFQEYLLLLKQRGLLLAVVSKNDERNAVEPFEQLPDMVLKREDFIAFKANWNPKPESIEQIARELNIGLDSLVFVDDNPAERELVRRVLPQVKVVELTNDPAEYPTLLDQSGWLEVVRLTDEDAKKTEQYRGNVERSATLAEHADYEGYLASLEQRAVIRPFEPKHLNRITQLINKTNQFNLTTPRLTRSEVEALLARAHTVTAYVRLTDRFGDNGLISVVCGQVERDALHIDLWLMSCRVLKRGVERLVANHLFDCARDLKLRVVRGVYRPTTKNRMVEHHYADLGFARVAADDDGTTRWEMSVEDYRPATVQISASKEEER
jgi:FkbH-like protein